MKLSRAAWIVAVGAFAFAACGGEGPTSAPAPDLTVVEDDVTATPASTCRSKSDSDGPYSEFKTSLTRRIKQPGRADRVITISATNTKRWWYGETYEEKLTVQYNGSPLFEQAVQRYSFASDVTMSQTYFPPYKGVSYAYADVYQGTIYGAVEGRTFTPAPVGTPASSMRYDDGQPGPKVTLDPVIQSAMTDLLSQTKKASGKCALSEESPNVLFAQDTTPHQSDTRSNLTCQSCRGGCMVAAGTCFYFAATSIACGPFVFFCAAGEIALCTGTELLCLSGCHNPSLGGACCPVGCGGESQPNFFSPPPPGQSVGCCASGETCLNRSSALCCSSGTSACGGKSCCGAGQACISSGVEAGTCCGGPGDSLCGTHCCKGGSSCTIKNGQPACCTGCTTDAQCGPQGTTDVNRCNAGCCEHIVG